MFLDIKLLTKIHFIKQGIITCVDYLFISNLFASASQP
ncbi:hypothetical protein PULV_a2676 [Pseudoalteromonas ulvae UL12]|nr:hypothetical protein [Pseudoalteromonas ulvae UL12]